MLKDSMFLCVCAVRYHPSSQGEKLFQEDIKMIQNGLAFCSSSYYIFDFLNDLPLVSALTILIS